jgi:hypothetical protein
VYSLVDVIRLNGNSNNRRSVALFLSGLFIEVVSRSDCTVSNGMIINQNEVEGLHKEADVAFQGTIPALALRG